VRGTGKEILLDAGDPLAAALVAAIQAGDVPRLEELLRENPGVAAARIDRARTLLHVAADWPGHFPNGAQTVAALAAAGADVNARFIGNHAETPLHWAASSDDVAVLDALLDAGADIEADGSVIGGGTPLADATAFGQWRAARRLVERGARVNLWQAAALGLTERVAEHFAAAEPPARDAVTGAFWGACHGGQKGTAEYLLDRGADLNWVGWNGLTPMGAALRSGAEELAHWLADRGAR
jgi:uncharacterized protein